MASPSSFFIPAINGSKGTHTRPFIRSIPVVIILLTAFTSTAPDDGRWKKARERDGITIHTRDVDSARVKEVRTTTRFNTSPSLLAFIIADVENRSRWFKQCESVKVIEELGPGHFIYRMMIDAPFPASDRDLVQEMKISQDPDSRIVTIILKARPDFLPQDEDYKRVPVGDGKWTISPNSGNYVDIIFTYLNDPGHGIPAGVVNLMITESPFQTMQHIKNDIESHTYTHGFDWIVD